jgi:hypothetical protein
MHVLYFTSMLRYWHLVWILVRTNHPCLGVGCHREQIIPKLVHKSVIIQYEIVIYLHDAGTKHLTLLVIPKSHILLVWQGSETGELFLISGHVSWTTEIHELRVLQASIHHLHRMRKGRWLSTGVSEINFRNATLNHTTWEDLHSLLHLTMWTSGMLTTIGKHMDILSVWAQSECKTIQ